MNNAKMWLVVKPTVGVPLFLSAVAVGSFAVHVAVLTNTSWVGDFLQGQPLGTGDQVSSLAVPQDSTGASNASFTTSSDATGQTVTLMLPDGTVTKAVLALPDSLASADGPPRAQITQ
jgi:light-harvesting protein B-800-850 alpha chain